MMKWTNMQMMLKQLLQRRLKKGVLQRMFRLPHQMPQKKKAVSMIDNVSFPTDLQQQTDQVHHDCNMNLKVGDFTLLF